MPLPRLAEPLFGTVAIIGVGLIGSSIAHAAAKVGACRRLVAVYSSNADRSWPGVHVRHRRFTDHVAATQPAWRLLAHLPNPYPFDPARTDETSFADFFVYGRVGTHGEPCVIRAPAG